MVYHAPRRVSALAGTLLLLAVLLQSVALSQYYISRQVVLPDTALTAGTVSLPIPTNKEDVKAIGMGKTGVANGRLFTGMMYNPALLAESKVRVDALNLQASMPPETFEASRYLQGHITEFKDALSLKSVRASAHDLLQPGRTAQEILNDLQSIQNGLRFPNELLTTVIGSADNPTIHGFRVVPSFTAQLGNFGFSIYGTLQSAFEVIQSPTMNDLLNVKLPSSITTQADLDQAMQAANQLITILDAVIDPITGNIDIKNAYPTTIAVSYLDIVGAAGYGLHLTDALSVGANLKVVNRRFSTEYVVSEKVDEIWSQVRQSFQSSVTGVTADLGATYRLPSGLQLGLALQNIIPVQKVSSSVTQTVTATGNAYDLDAMGNYQLNGNGDTALVALARRVAVTVPFELKLPFIMNAGARYAINSNWDVAFDWADIAAQDVRYETYIERFRIGTEYRFEAIEDMFGITPRVGLADKRPTVGLGINLFRFLQIDGAYAYDNYVGANSYYAQVRIGW